MPWNGKEVRDDPKHLIDNPVDINAMNKKSPGKQEVCKSASKRVLKGRFLTYKEKKI